jgi:hypothetical protein
MPSPRILLALLLSVCVSLATALHLRMPGFRQTASQSDSLAAAILGESRKLLAIHFFIKADAYFHSGYYPSIFDQAAARPSAMLDRTGSEDAPDPHAPPPTHLHEDEDEDEDHRGHRHDPEDELAFLEKPRDWIERFGRHFFPSAHSHLDGTGQEREMLPWLRLSATLDPHNTKTYTIAAYWLRTRMDRIDEAEQFLREGWRNNPDSYEILFELGRLFNESRHDPARARNVWELALKKWQAQEGQKKEPDTFSFQQILAQLAFLEEKEMNWAKAVEYLEILKKVSPRPDTIEQRLREAREKAKSAF